MSNSQSTGSRSVRVGQIRFPRQVIDALDAGRLVIFAGAGVSMGEPANLPDFEELAKRVVAPRKGPGGSEPFEAFLGRAADDGVRVHKRTAEILGGKPASESTSLPTRLHTSLLKMFPEGAAVRIVTTNFDRLFESAAKASGPRELDIYRAPALPLGRDFKGIVYLHGNVACPDQMVLTDRDFGRAYLTDGWATRFLLDVFQNFTVLFVGYSHSDPVVTYLARAIPPGAGPGRFALVETPEQRWSGLGVEPVEFGKGQFEILNDAFEVLVRYMRRRPKDWKASVEELGGSVPPSDSAVLDELEFGLRQDFLLTAFLRKAASPEWLPWLAERGYLKGGEKGAPMVWYLANQFQVERSDGLVERLVSGDLELGEREWGQLADCLARHHFGDAGRARFRRWMHILRANLPDAPKADFLGALVERCVGENDLELAVGWFLELTRLRVEVSTHDAQIQRLLGTGGWKPNVAVKALAEPGTALEVWERNLRPHLGDLAEPLLEAVCLHLEAVHRDLVAWGKANDRGSPLDMGRAAIEAHAQNRNESVPDVLTDAARDSLEWICDHSPSSLDYWVRRLNRSKEPLLRRLAVHAVRRSSHWPAARKLEWIADRVGLFAVAEHHESLVAAGAAYATSTPNERAQFLERLAEEPQSRAEVAATEVDLDRHRFSWLVSLQSTAPDCGQVNAALATLKLRYPDWETVELPEFLSYWTEAAGWTRESPVTTAELLARPAQAWVEEFGQRNPVYDQLDEDALHRAIATASKERPDWAFDFLRALPAAGQGQHRRLASLLSGLTGAGLSAAQWHSIFEVLEAREPIDSMHSLAASCLVHFSVGDPGQWPTALSAKAAEIADDVWSAVSPNPEPLDCDDWAAWTANSPCGKILEYRTRTLLWASKSGSESRSRAFSRFVAAIGDTFTERTAGGAAARVLVAGNVSVLSELDAAWVSERVLPLLASDDPQTFRQAWAGLVWSGRVPRLAGKSWSRLCASVAGRADLLSPRLQRRFAQMLCPTVLPLTGGVDTRLLNLFASKGPHVLREDLAVEVGRGLKKFSAKRRQEVWARGLSKHWKDRLDGSLPIPEPKELSRMLGWLPYLGDAYPEAVDMFLNANEPKRLRLEAFPFHELRTSDQPGRHPDETARLLVFVLETPAAQWSWQIQRLSSELKGVSEGARTRLEDALVRAGLEGRVGESSEG